MLRKLITPFLFGIAYAFGQAPDTCLPKLHSGDLREPVCDTLAVRKPMERIIFIIQLKFAPGNEFDSAHKAAVKIMVHDLYTKYDLRNFPDTTKRMPIPEIADYGNGPLFVLRKDVDSLVKEEYVSRLEYHARMPTVIISPITQHERKRSKSFEVDVRGVQAGAAHRLHSILFFAPKL